MLRRTTILPTDSGADARRMLRELIHDEPLKLFIVLGKGQEAETLAHRASVLSGTDVDARWVVWGRKPDQIEEVIAELDRGNRAEADVVDSRGFVTSLADSVVDVIGQADRFDLIRVLRAWAAADRGSEV